VTLRHNQNMTATRTLGAIACAFVFVLLTSQYPLTINDNLSCGGITGRVATVGSYNSGEGEPSEADKALAARHAEECQAKARTLIAVAGFTGALAGFVAVALYDRRRGAHGRRVVIPR
jgi:hypothetical protein